MTTFDELALPFARSIRAKAECLIELPLTSRQEARLRQSISEDIRKFCDIASPEFLPPAVSIAARAAASRLGMDFSLRNKTWHDQHRFDPGRKVFHLEHQIPVATVRAECLRQPSEAAVVEVLRTRLRIVWILKTENGALTRLGYGTKRPDPEAAYAEAGITIAPNDS